MHQHIGAEFPSAPIFTCIGTGNDAVSHKLWCVASRPPLIHSPVAGQAGIKAGIAGM